MAGYTNSYAGVGHAYYDCTCDEKVVLITFSIQSACKRRYVSPVDCTATTDKCLVNILSKKKPCFYAQAVATHYFACTYV